MRLFSLLLLFVNWFSIARSEDIEDIFDYVAAVDVMEMTINSAVSRYLPNRKLEPDHIVQMTKEFLEFQYLPEAEKEEILAGLPTKFRFIAVLLKAARKQLKKEFAALSLREQTEYGGSEYEYVIYQLTDATYARILKEKKADYEKRGLTKKQIKREMTLRTIAVLDSWRAHGPLSDVVASLQRWRETADLPEDILEAEAEQAGKSYEQRLQELRELFSDEDDDDERKKEEEEKPAVKNATALAEEARAPFDIVREKQEAAATLSDCFDYVSPFEVFERTIEDLTARYTPGRAYSRSEIAQLQRELIEMVGAAQEGEDPQALMDLIDGRSTKYAKLATLFDAFRDGAIDEFEALSEEDQEAIESVRIYILYMINDFSRLRLYKANKAEFARRKLTKAQIKQELSKREAAIVEGWRAAAAEAENSAKSEL